MRCRRHSGGGIGEVAGDLRHPIPIGPAGDAGDVNASRFEVDDEEHEVAHEAPACEHLDGEEVRRGDGAPMGFEESLPGHRLATERRRLDAVRPEDALDGGAPKAEAQVAQCAAKARVDPGRHHEQLADLVIAGGSTARRPAGTTPVVLGGNQLPEPRRMVSGVASEASSPNSLRPRGFPFSASARRSASVSRSRWCPSRTRSSRFSARKYSIASPCL